MKSHVPYNRVELVSGPTLSHTPEVQARILRLWIGAGVAALLGYWLLRGPFLIIPNVVLASAVGLYLFSLRNNRSMGSAKRAEFDAGYTTSRTGHFQYPEVDPVSCRVIREA